MPEPHQKRWVQDPAAGVRDPGLLGSRLRGLVVRDSGCQIPSPYIGIAGSGK